MGGVWQKIQKATELARSMVTKWGLSDVLGPVKYGEDSHQPFLGHSMGTSHVREFSETTAATIDAEIRQLIERNYARTVQILKDNIDILHAMSEALIQYETLDVDQVNDLMARRPVKPSVWEETHLAASAPAVTEEAAPADTAESGSSDASGSPQISGEVGVSKVSDSSEASNVSQASQGDAQATSDTPKAPAASKDKDTPS
jgi:cell division protease FtsH